MTKKLNYYDEFINNMEYVIQSASILKEHIENFDETKSMEIEGRVHNLENQADNRLHEILNYLTKDFVPPFDREDIITISSAIDDLEDNIDEVVINLNIFNIIEIRDDVKNFARLIYEACEKLIELFGLLKNNKERSKMYEIVVNINELEGVGDSMFQNAISNLFAKEKNPIEVIKWQNIYNSLEDCMDQAEIVANCVEETIMKMG